MFYFLIFISAFIAILLIGFNYYTTGQANHDERKSKIGKWLMLSPFCLLGIYILSFYLYGKISFKPNENDLIGKYEISEVSNLDINEFGKTNLEFLQNGEFHFINNSKINICDNGNYKLYRSDNERGVSFDCGDVNSSAKIVSSLWSYEIEFIIGDPDSGESIYFKKIEN